MHINIFGSLNIVLLIFSDVILMKIPLKYAFLVYSSQELNFQLYFWSS